MISALDQDPDAARNETVRASDVGLPAAAALPFEFTAGHDWSPLVISFPHVGLEWPADEPQLRPAVNFARNADFAVDHLYPGAAALGAATLRARYSRLLIDLNRAPDDVSSALVPDHPAPRPQRPPWATSGPAPVHNRGLIWQTAVGNVQILRTPLAFADLQARLSRYYDPYHAALALLLQRRRARFGFAVLLDAHSMPSSIPGDLVLGTFEGGACGPELERRALTALRGDGPARFRVCLNDPYRGGELVRKFGRPEHGVHALQLEVNRGLYMDEANLVLRREVRAGLAVSHPAEIPDTATTSRPSGPASRPSGSESPATSLTSTASTPTNGREAAPLLLLHRVKSLVSALAATSLPTNHTMAPARQPLPDVSQPSNPPQLVARSSGSDPSRPSEPDPSRPSGPEVRRTAHFGEPLCRRRPRG